MMKPCRNCKKEFEAKGAKLYCSRICGIDYLKSSNFACKTHGIISEKDLYVFMTTKLQRLNRVCGICYRERLKKYRSLNPNVARKARKKWKDKNKEKQKIIQTNWKNNNKEKLAILNKQSAARRRKNLGSSYAKKAIIGKSSLMASDIPTELVELKRQQLLIKRKIKELKND